jgi:hypothetical protein
VRWCLLFELFQFENERRKEGYSFASKERFR